MARNTSFSLGDHFSDFVDSQVKAGRYSNASDVVRAGLRLLEEQEIKLAALRQALVEGEESGEPQELNVDRFLVSRRRRGTGEV